MPVWLARPGGSAGKKGFIRCLEHFVVARGDSVAGGNPVVDTVSADASAAPAIR